MKGQIAMLLKQWRGWDWIQRATFVAQVATSAAFLGSSIFSYLSWQEARGAREDQKIFFISEKRPLLKLSRDESKFDSERNFNIRINMLNQGLSTAKNIRMRVTGWQSKKDSGRILEVGDLFDCFPDYIEKDDHLYCNIEVKNEKMKSLGLSQTSVKIFSDYTLMSDDYLSKYSLEVDYDGIFNDQHLLSIWMEVK